LEIVRAVVHDLELVKVGLAIVVEVYSSKNDEAVWTMLGIGKHDVGPPTAWLNATSVYGQ